MHLPPTLAPPVLPINDYPLLIKTTLAFRKSLKVSRGLYLFSLLTTLARYFSW
jgi:hypothetical protein